MKQKNKKQTLKNVIKYHKKLAKYFLGKPIYLDSANQKNPNIRLCVELPWQETQANMWDTLSSSLTNLNFLEAKVIAGKALDLLIDFNTAISSMPRTHADWKIIEILQNALQRDILFITQHSDIYPQALFQCLWNSCWWYDNPESEAHYKIPIGGWNKENAPWLAEGKKIYKLVEKWRRDRKQTPWFRSLRPQQSPLGISITEFRTFNHKNYISKVVFLPNGSNLISGTNGGKVEVWNIFNFTKVRVMQIKGFVTGLACSANGIYLGACAGYGEIIIWNTNKYDRCISHTLNKNEVPNDISFSPKRNIVAVACNDGIIRIWDLETGRTIPSLIGHQKRANYLAFSPIHPILASTSDDSTVKIWNLETGRFIDIITVSETLQLCFSLNGSLLAFYEKSGYITIFNVKSGKKVLRKPIPGEEYVVETMSFLPSKSNLLCVSTKGIRFTLDVKTECFIDTLDLSSALFISRGFYRFPNISFSPDYKGIAAGLDKGVIRIIDINRYIENFIVWNHIDPIISTAVSPAGNLIASHSDDGELRIFSTETNNFEIIHQTSQAIQFGFSKDNSMLQVFDSYNEPMFAYNLLRKKKMINFIRDVFFSTEGKFLMNSSIYESISAIYSSTNNSQEEQPVAVFNSNLHGYSCDSNERIWAGGSSNYLYVLCLEDIAQFN